MRKVYVYCTEDGWAPVLSFINDAGIKFRKKFDFLIRYISDEKNNLYEPYVKHFAIERYKKLYELRLRSDSVMIRIIFYLTEDEDAILLYAFYKKDKRDTERALEYALKLVDSLNIRFLKLYEI